MPGRRVARRARAGVGSALSLYHELAEHYDGLYSWKDYRSEARRLAALAERFGRSDGVRWLDVACGTGHHLEHLRAAYSVVGVDASPEMLHVARRRLPGVRLIRGDMRTFRLAEEFDVVSCLFSAIGALRTERDVRRTLGNLARHTAPGGVVIVEPWIDPSSYRPGHVHLTKWEGPSEKVVRVAYSQRRGDRSVIHYQYLVGVQGRGVRHYEETDVGLMVPRRRLLAWMEAAGLRARYLPRGLTGNRGLLVGTKPSSGTTARSR